MAAAIDARPWLEDDEELRNLWIQGIVEDRDITAEEWGATDWFEGQNQEVIDCFIDCLNFISSGLLPILSIP